MSLIEQSLSIVHRQMAEAIVATGRAHNEITLIAVSKTFPVEAVMDAIDAGQVDIGENRVEEALPKMAHVAEHRPNASVRWHLIGHVQSRKAKDVAGKFALIHSVDSTKLADKLSAACQANGTYQDILLECNVSGEDSKEGFALSNWQTTAEVLDRFMRDIEHISTLPSLTVRGLMTMAPIVAQSDDARPVFASLRALRDTLRERFPNVSWDHLSMGMTNDFKAAIAEGATMIRIGRAIFGDRSLPLP